MTFKFESLVDFLSIFIVSFLKQDLIVGILFILRGGKNMTHLLPLQFYLDT